MAGEGVIASIFIRLGIQNEASSQLRQADKDFERTAASGGSLADKIGSLSGSFTTVGHNINTAMNWLDRYEISQMTVENASRRVENAQMRYNEAVAKYGEKSKEATLASNELQNSQNNLEKANIRATSSMVLIGISALSMIPQFIAAGKAIVLFATTGRLVIGGLAITMGTLMPWLVAIGAVLGVLYYWYSKNAEKAYEFRSEQDALAMSGELVASSGYSQVSANQPLLESLYGLSQAQDTYSEALEKALEDGEIDAKEKLKLAVLAGILEGKTKDVAKAILDSGMSYEEAQAFLKPYGKTVEDLGLTQEDFKKKIEDTTEALDTQTKKVPDWKDAFVTNFGLAGSAVVTFSDTFMQKSYETGIKIGEFLVDSGAKFGKWVSDRGADFGTFLTNAETWRKEIIWKIGNAWERIKADAIAKWEEIKTSALTKWEEIKSAIWTPIQKTYDKIVEIKNNLSSWLSTKWEEIKTSALTKWEEIKSAIWTPIQKAYDKIVEIKNNLSSWLSTKWEEIKTSALTKWEEIKAAIWNPIQTVYNKIVEKWDEALSTLGTAWDNLKILAGEKWAAISNAIWNALPLWFQQMLLKIYAWEWPELPSWTEAWTAMLNAIYALLPSWFKVLLGLEAPPPPPWSGDWSNYSDWSGDSGPWPNWGADTWTGDWQNWEDSGWSGNWTADWSGDWMGPYAKGGIFTKPARPLIAEAGPEAVIPLPGFLSKTRDITVNMEFNAPIYGINDLENAMSEAIENLKWKIKSLGG